MHYQILSKNLNKKMRKFLTRFWSVLVLVAFSACFLLAQGTPPETTDPAEVFGLIKVVANAAEAVGLWGAVYGAVVIMFGYLSNFIPIINKIPSASYRVLAGGIIIAVIGIKFGFLENWQVIVSFVFSTKLYEYVLALIKKSNEVNPQGIKKV